MSGNGQSHQATLTCQRVQFYFPGSANLVLKLWERRHQTPNLQVFNNALLTSWISRTLAEWKHDSESGGQLVESAVGAHLVNQARLNHAEIFKWNNDSKEVDFVIQRRNDLLLVGLKSARRSKNNSGFSEFLKLNPKAKQLPVGTGGIPLYDFLSSSLDKI